eukprot:3909404-Prymnesium_polylepis.1
MQPGGAVEAVLTDADLLGVIFSTLKPLSDKPRAYQVNKKFRWVLCHPVYNVWRNRKLALQRRAHNSMPAVLGAPRWCSCTCFRIRSEEGSSMILLSPKCGHFPRFRALVQNTRGRDFNHSTKEWTVPTPSLFELARGVYITEPDALLPGVRAALDHIYAPCPPPPPTPPIDPAADDPAHDRSKFAGIGAVAERRPALQAKEMAMRGEEARLWQMESDFFRRRDALRELRNAVRSASVSLTPRVWPGDGEAELADLLLAMNDAEATGADKADGALMARAHALVAELEAEQARAAAAAARAAAEARLVAAAARLSAALDATEEPLAH